MVKGKKISYMCKCFEQITDKNSNLIPKKVFCKTRNINTLIYTQICMKRVQHYTRTRTYEFSIRNTTKQCLKSKYRNHDQL